MKSPALVPPIGIEVSCNVAWPVLVMVNDIGWVAMLISCDPKLSVVVLNETAGEAPVPESAIECGLPAALSVDTRFAERAPASVGLNDTVPVNVPPGPIVAGKVLNRPNVTLVPPVT